MTASPCRRRVAMLIVGGCLALFPLRCSAALYWDSDGVTAGNNTSTGAGLGGSGNWDDAGKWFDGVSVRRLLVLLPPTPFSLARLELSRSTRRNPPIRSLSKRTATLITGSTLTLGPTPANITTDAGVTATIASTIAGSATMTKLGPGTLVLANNNNTNTADTTGGGWKIEGGGTLVISSDTALGAALPDAARNTVTDIQFNQSTIKFGADMTLSQNRRTKVNTNSSTQNLGDAVIDVNEHTISWFGSIQGGLGTLRSYRRE